MLKFPAVLLLGSVMLGAAASAPEPAPPPPPPVDVPAVNDIIYAITDVHGCRDLLERAYDRIVAHAEGRPARVIFLGDAIDRGPDSKGVIDRLIASVSPHPDTGKPELWSLGSSHTCVRRIPWPLAKAEDMTPEEIAGLVGYLATDAPPYLTGQVLIVDGGLT